MGLKREEILSLTIAEFNLMHVGYQRRNEKDWDIARRTWAYTMIYGGLGLKGDQTITPEKLWSLPFTDRKEVTITKITTMEQALQLLNEF